MTTKRIKNLVHETKIKFENNLKLPLIVNYKLYGPKPKDNIRRNSIKFLLSFLRYYNALIKYENHLLGDFFQYTEKFDRYFIKLQIIVNKVNEIYLRYAVFEDLSFKNDHYNSDEDIRTCEWDREIFFIEKILNQYLHKRISLLNIMNIRFD